MLSRVPSFVTPFLPFSRFRTSTSPVRTSSRPSRYAICMAPKPETTTDPFEVPVASKNGVATPNLPSTSGFPDVHLEEPNPENSESPNDIARIGVVASIVGLIGILLQHDWVESHRDLTMELIFILGYLGITLEEILCYDKTGVALLMGVGIWTTFTEAGAGLGVDHLLSEQVSDISQILFFLIGAMTIVEIIDGHRGFKVVTDFITTNDRRVLMWAIALLTFFTSAILDNLTSTIVVVSLIRKLVRDRQERWLLGAVAVVAANAGGAWTPIGGRHSQLLHPFS